MIRVIHLPTTVGGNPQGLSRELTRQGVSSSTVVFSENTFAYGADEIVWNPNDSKVVRELKRFRLLWKVIKDYDVVHFNFGRTIFSPPPPWHPEESLLRNAARLVYSNYMNICQLGELWLLRAKRIAMFVHYQGDDARQGDVSLRKFEVSVAANVSAGYYNRFSDRNKRAQIHRLNKFCSKIYALNPDLLYVLPGRAEFIPYCHVCLDDWRPVYSQLHDGRLRIGHAPSNRAAKGTALIEAVLNELAHEGYSFEFVLVEGVSHAEAKRRYEQIDVLIDQVLYGWYGGLALECMALGKPVLVYIRESDLGFLPAGMADELPVVRIDPRTLKDDLRKVLRMPRVELRRLGERSRHFVEKWHDPTKIADRVRADYRLALRSLQGGGVAAGSDQHTD